MDTRFQPALAAIVSGNIEKLRALLGEDPTLATARSSCSHPTLLQGLALDAVAAPNKVEMARLLIEGGAEVDGPLIAAACINNVEVAEALLDAGAAIDGTGEWSPLEETLYWNPRKTADMFLKRGASVRNLRTAAALGRLELVESFFNHDGTLKPEAGKIDWPFGGLAAKSLEQKNWQHSRQNIINNAFVYACMHNQIEVARLLLGKGAQINEIPPGFDFAGTGLHYAALNGHRAMVEFLISNGADPRIKDTKVSSPASGWAEHGGHHELKQYLEALLSVSQKRRQTRCLT